MSVLFEVKNHVARVTISRPESMNALDSKAAARMEDIWQQIEADTSIRCVVLTGAGERAFCAGADLKEDRGLSGVDYWAQSNPNGFGGISLRRSLATPVIARVNGLALGGGMEMVLGCDIVIASENAKFGLPEAKVGRVPLDGGMILLPRLIPRNVAMDMMMTGRMAKAEEMAVYGLVNSVVSADRQEHLREERIRTFDRNLQQNKEAGHHSVSGETEDALDAEVDKWVDNILKSAPLSLRAIKATARDTASMTPQAAHALRTPELIAALASEDSDEGVRAFREKRTPVWRGQ